MEKSIESIWKEGFLNSKEFIAPKLNNLYNKKSEHIVDKFTRVFKINLIAIVAGSFFVMAMAWAVDIPYMGVGLFVLANTLAFINSKLMKGLGEIDKNVNSYQYLKTFDSWLKEMIAYNQKFARVFYPFAILSVAAGFWFGSFGGDIPGDMLVNELMISFPEMILLFGFPLYLCLGLILTMAVLAFSAGRIYKWDLNIVYGRLFKKLDEILADMEELRV
ncbi:MAG: hypothetical protein ACI8QD_002937 [Cyclobacteriaceae bacterium]|jgi:hypothetical protein